MTKPETRNPNWMTSVIDSDFWFPGLIIHLADSSRVGFFLIFSEIPDPRRHCLRS